MPRSVRLCTPAQSGETTTLAGLLAGQSGLPPADDAVLIASGTGLQRDRALGQPGRVLHRARRAVPGLRVGRGRRPRPPLALPEA